jgi:hypothetical protein
LIERRTFSNSLKENMSRMCEECVLSK